MELVDTHCHLQFDSLASNLDGVISEASAAGVKKLICVGTSLADSKTAAAMAVRSKDVWAAAGAHPHEATQFLADLNSPRHLKKLLDEPRVVAVGEIGLDFYRSTTPAADQELALRAQLEAGLKTGLPFIFHVRDAWMDFWRIYDEYKINAGVVHSFSAGPKQLEQVLSRGLYVGLNGIMTFTRDETQLSAAKQVPNDRILLETDAPFLTPAAYRGQLCEPKHIVSTAEFLAQLRAQPLTELAATSTLNAEKLFKI